MIVPVGKPHSPLVPAAPKPLLVLKFAEHLQIDLVKVLARSKKKTFFEKNSDTKHTQEEKVEDSQVEQPLRSQREAVAGTLLWHPWPAVPESPA